MLGAWCDEEEHDAVEGSGPALLLRTEPSLAPVLSARLAELISCLDEALALRFSEFTRTLTVAGKPATEIGAAELSTAGNFRRADAVYRPTRKRARPW